MISLTILQKELMKQFYNIPPTKVIFNKKERNILWQKATKRYYDINFNMIKKLCPALYNQIIKSYESGRNIQSAVFSECVYAQTFANMLQLNSFHIYNEKDPFIPESAKHLLESNHLIPRYVYSSNDKKTMLFQAGGCNGIDCALITNFGSNIYTIEFKEPEAKTSEPDLPKYGEDGNLLITKDFLEKYPHFEKMLSEQKNLNFFKVMGSNINNFSESSVNFAVSNNYIKKCADVICTEDVNGYFVMIPSNEVSLWAKIVGEIRPAGRNHYKVWTPNALSKFLKEKGALIDGDTITIHKNKLDIRKERGGNGHISGYKINPLFFIYVRYCGYLNGYITFNIHSVEQLKPTISAKMFFKNLKYDEVHNYYKILY